MSSGILHDHNYKIPHAVLSSISLMGTAIAGLIVTIQPAHVRGSKAQPCPESSLFEAPMR